jgi:hypothetical protein
VLMEVRREGVPRAVDGGGGGGGRGHGYGSKWGLGNRGFRLGPAGLRLR